MNRHSSIEGVEVLQPFIHLAFSVSSSILTALYLTVINQLKRVEGGKSDFFGRSYEQQIFARGLVMLGERDEALGEVWHIPTPGPTMGWEFVHAIFEEGGSPPKIGALSSTIVKTLGLFWPLAREGAETVYPFEKSFVVDGGEYRRTFGGYEATPYREGIRQTIDWYRQGSVKAKLAGNGTRKRQVPHKDHAGSKL